VVIAEMGTLPMCLPIEKSADWRIKF